MKYSFYLALFILIVGCSDSTSTTTPVSDSTTVESTNNMQGSTGGIDEAKTKQVLDHHWEAFTTNNLEEVMKDYTEESVLVTPDVTYKGLAEIRKNFESANQKFPADKSTFKLTKSVIDRDLAYILWQSKTPSFNLSFATDSFIIRDGKIIRQTYAGVATPL